MMLEHEDFDMYLRKLLFSTSAKSKTSTGSYMYLFYLLTK